MTLPPAPAGERVKIRMPWSVLLLFSSAPMLGYSIGLGAMTAATGPSPSTGYIWNAIFGITTATLLIGLLNLTVGATLTPTELIVCGLRRRHIPWPEVTAVTFQTTLGTRYVRIWTRNGRTRRLRAPITCFGVGRARFDADLATIGNWWLTHVPSYGWPRG